RQVGVKLRRVGPVPVPVPEYQTPGSAGVDLSAALEAKVTIAPGERRLIPTGVALAIPEGYEGQVRPRSGLALRAGLSIVNSPGALAADFRGESGVVLGNHGSEPVVVEPPPRLAQLPLTPAAQARCGLAQTLDDPPSG